MAFTGAIGIGTRSFLVALLARAAAVRLVGIVLGPVGAVAVEAGLNMLRAEISPGHFIRCGADESGRSVNGMVHALRFIGPGRRIGIRRTVRIRRDALASRAAIGIVAVVGRVV